MIYPNGHIDYVLKLDGVDLVGVAKVHMPEVNYKTVTVEGAGVMGSMEVPLGGMIDPMSASIDFSSCTDAILKLGDNQWHTVALYDAFQYFDQLTGQEDLEANRFEMSIRATKVAMGTIATASAADASGEYSVRKYAVYKAGSKVVDIDQLAGKFLVNGTDCAQPIRQALGMM